MKISTVGKIGAAVLNGVWVDNIPNLPGVRLKVVGATHPAARRIGSEMYAALPESLRSNTEEIAKIERQQMVDVLLVGWEGFEDDSGNPLEYSKERAEHFLADKDIAAVLVDGINNAVSRVGAQALQEVNSASKN